LDITLSECHQYVTGAKALPAGDDNYLI